MSVAPGKDDEFAANDESDLLHTAAYWYLRKQAEQGWRLQARSSTNGTNGKSIELADENEDDVDGLDEDVIELVGFADDSDGSALVSFEIKVWLRWNSRHWDSHIFPPFSASMIGLRTRNCRPLPPHGRVQVDQDDHDDE